MMMPRSNKVLPFRRRVSAFRVHVRREGNLYWIIREPGEREVLATNDPIFASQYVNDRNGEQGAVQ